MNPIVLAIVVLVVLGLAGGVILVLASKFMAVYEDPRIAQITECLAGANCGCCGYPTCRDKAIAVYEGRAEISMCMPYMKERAETYSEKIINVSPEGIVTVGKKLKVKQINKAACKIFGIKDPADIIGYPVSRIMDEYLSLIHISEPTRH